MRGSAGSVSDTSLRGGGATKKKPRHTVYGLRSIVTAAFVSTVFSSSAPAPFRSASCRRPAEIG